MGTNTGTNTGTKHEPAASRGLLPDVITYSAAISACEKGQKPQQALHLLQELQLRGLLPNVITYNAAISACGLAKRSGGIEAP